MVLRITLTIAIALTFFLAPEAALAQVDLKADVLNQLETGAQAAELGTPKDPRLIIAGGVKVFLSLLGTIFLGLVVYAAYLWGTSRGEESKIKQAKQTLTRAIVGIMLVLASYGITTFIATAIQKAVLDR